jgi:hypothetical protein
MFEMTRQAADAIATQCEKRSLPATAGIRIYPRRTRKPDSLQTLVVEYVDGAEEGDSIIRHGSAAVFLAEGVDEIVGTRVLDVQDSAAPSPQLLLRTRALAG